MCIYKKCPVSSIFNSEIIFLTTYSCLSTTLIPINFTHGDSCLTCLSQMCYLSSASLWLHSYFIQPNHSLSQQGTHNFRYFSFLFLVLLIFQWLDSGESIICYLHYLFHPLKSYYFLKSELCDTMAFNLSPWFSEF